MLRVDGAAKFYGPRKLFSGISFILNPGEKAALTGPNGAGKSTILDIVSGVTPPSTGSITLSPGAVVAYLRQGYEELTGVSVEEAACSVLPQGGESVRRLRAAEVAVARDTSSEALDEYQSAADGFAASGAERVTARIIEALSKVGLDGVSPDALLGTLSGGQRSRIALAGIIAAQPDILLLDEPTNHLDLPALEWLEDFVSSFRGTALVVSHDRVFLDNTVTRVMEIDPEKGDLTDFHGNYSEYVAEKDRAQAARLQMWREQEAEVRRIRADILRLRDRARSLEVKRRPDDIPKIMWNPGRIAKGVAKLAKARESKLERFDTSDQRLEKPSRRWRMKLDLEPGRRAGDIVARLEDLAAGYGGLNVLDGVQGEVERGERIALMGPNGSGKSTLLRILDGAQEPGSGVVRLGAGVTVGYMPQEHTGFGAGDTPLSVLRAAHGSVGAGVAETEVRNFLHFFLFQGDHVFTPVELLSYGERARLFLAQIVARRPNLLLLDEPLNHLDIPSRERFEEALLNYNGTTIAATHDRAFVDSWATTVWWLEPGEQGATLSAHRDRVEMERMKE